MPRPLYDLENGIRANVLKYVKKRHAGIKVVAPTNCTDGFYEEACIPPILTTSSTSRSSSCRCAKYFQNGAAKVLQLTGFSKDQ